MLTYLVSFLYFRRPTFEFIMIKQILGLLMITVLFTSCNNKAVSTHTNIENQPEKNGSGETISLEDIYASYEFYADDVWGIRPMNNGKSFSKIEGKIHPSIVKYSLITGEKETIMFDGSKHQLKFNSYQFNDDESQLLLATETESIYRHSTKSQYYIYNIAKNKLTELASGAKQIYPTFSPDGKKIAFVQENNLKYKNLETGIITDVTTNGKSNQIINGMSDWVYEEEFVLTRAYEWSPNSEKIAYLSFNESHVKQFSMDMYGDLYPNPYRFKYPKAGEKNSIISTFIFHLNTNTNKEIETGKNDDVYFPRIKWTPSQELVIFKMNRHQNQIQLLKANETTNTTSVLFEEKNPYYISEDVLDEMEFLTNGDFLWTSERSGYKHIYLFNKDGKLKTQITKGDYDVMKLYGYDSKSNKVFYQAAEKSPLEREVYSIQLNGSDKKNLTIDKGSNSASFTPNFNYFIHRYSSTDQPTVITIRDNEGKPVRLLVDNQELKEKIQAKNLPKVEFIKVPTDNNVDLNGYILKPVNFDATKQYPLLMFVYGGPGSQQVKNKWGLSNYLWHSYLTQKGYIVACIDNRGTGARGQEFKKSTYQELGKLEVIDQTNAAKHFGNLPYINKDRIGIWGWSYGGYMSSLSLFKSNDVFKTAIAVAPVTTWRYYDTIYTERYMRTPQENPTGYDNNSPINHVDKLKGNYLLVHGMADDNVHFQNAVDLITALNKANKQYDLAIYPNKNHGIYGGNTRLHLYKKMTNFILEKL